MTATIPVSDVRTARLHRDLNDIRGLLIDHIDRIIRELQNALTHVSASRIPLDSHLAEIALQELVGGDPEVRIQADTVMVVTAEYFRYTAGELRGARGTNTLCRARQIAMYLCRELTGLSLPAIGSEFDRDHTTVMHAVRKIRDEVAAGGQVREQARDLAGLVKKQAAMDALQDVRSRLGEPRRRRESTFVGRAGT